MAAMTESMMTWLRRSRRRVVFRLRWGWRYALRGPRRWDIRECPDGRKHELPTEKALVDDASGEYVGRVAACKRCGVTTIFPWEEVR